MIMQIYIFMDTTKKCNLNGGLTLLIKNYEYFWMFLLTLDVSYIFVYYKHSVQFCIIEFHINA